MAGKVRERTLGREPGSIRHAVFSPEYTFTLYTQLAAAVRSGPKRKRNPGGNLC